MNTRFCLFTEELNPPFDEGYKNFTYNLFRLSRVGRVVHRLSAGDQSVIDKQVKAGKLLLCKEIRDTIREFHPDVLIYVPISSITPASFLRSRILKFYAQGAPVVMIGLQPRPLKPILRLVAPDIVYVQSRASKECLENAGFRAGIIQAGVDSDRFRPVGRLEKDSLRKKYMLDPDAYIVLHVGHIKEQRNIRVLGEVANISDVQVIIVGSTSTNEDKSLSLWLEKRGVRVIRGYTSRIEELYQLADAYVFPVTQETAAIEFPLSVLEAMACNLSVVTTQFGGLKDYFSDGDGLFFVEDPSQIPEKVDHARHFRPVNTYSKVESFTWQSVADRFFDEVEQFVHNLTRCKRD